MREPEGYREQLERLAERFPGKEFIGIADACAILGCDRRTLLGDKKFPAKRINGTRKYYIPIVKLAWWMASVSR